LTNEKSYRSLLKSISWRITGSLDTTLVSFIVTGNFKVAISIGSIEVFTKIVLYYFHERMWNKIKLGKEEKNDPEYNI
jgi:uncharacterized membrane protein